MDLGSVFLLSLSLKDTIATHQGATLHRHWWSLRSMSALVFIISVIIIKKIYSDVGWCGWCPHNGLQFPWVNTTVAYHGVRVVKWVDWRAFRSSTSTERHCRRSSTRSRVPRHTTSSSGQPRLLLTVSNARAYCGVWPDRDCVVPSAESRRTRSVKISLTPTVCSVS